MPVATSGKLSEKTISLLAFLSHLLYSFTCVLGPLILWVIKRTSGYVDFHGKESVNFNITMLIGYIAMIIIGIVTCGLGLLYPVLWVAHLVLSIMAAMASNEGKSYRYPVCIRLIK
ncbi:MAG: DUF4870 domain-containing protein [Verrucomicrobiales bacterium]